jgi:hypothetical protein
VKKVSSFALKGQRSFNPPQRGGFECPKMDRPEGAAEKIIMNIRYKY